MISTRRAAAFSELFYAEAAPAAVAPEIRGEQAGHPCEGVERRTARLPGRIHERPEPGEAPHPEEELGRPFTRLWVGFATASSGDGMTTGAVPLLAVVVDPHPLAVSAVVASDSLPWLLLALPAGAFADRFRRGPLMAVTNILRAAAIAVGAFLILSDRMTLTVLIVVVLVNAGGRAIYYSSLQAVVPDLVPSDALEYSNGVLVATEEATENLAGPVVGTWLFAMNKAIPFFADAIALAASCFPLVGFRSKAPVSEDSPPSVWEGVRFLWQDRRLRILILMVACLSGLQGMESGVLVLLATTKWGVARAPTGSSSPSVRPGASSAASRQTGWCGGSPVPRRSSVSPSPPASATSSWRRHRAGNWLGPPTRWSALPSESVPSWRTPSARG